MFLRLKLSGKTHCFQLFLVGNPKWDSYHISTSGSLQGWGSLWVSKALRHMPPAPGTLLHSLQTALNIHIWFRGETGEVRATPKDFNSGTFWVFEMQSPLNLVSVKLSNIVDHSL